MVLSDHDDSDNDEQFVLHEDDKNNKYDKYDIIDYLELDYLDYLDTIPQEIWNKYKKEIENSLFLIKDKKVIKYVMKKITIDLSQYITKNFKKINLELLKICFETDFIKIYKKIHKSEYERNQIYIECITSHDLEFNKYFYSTISEYKKKENIEKNKQGDKKKSSYIISNIFSLFLSKSNTNSEPEQIIIDIDFTNLFEKMYITQIIYSSKDLYKIKFEVFQYYIDIFDLTTKFDLIPFSKKRDIFKNMLLGQYNDYNNYEHIMKFKKILKISENDFVNRILFNIDKKYNGYLPTIYNVCESGNIDYFLSIINNFNISNDLLSENIIINMIVYAGISGNIDLVYIVYNYLSQKKPLLFTQELYSKIILFLIKRSSNHYKVHRTIYEMINLGGIIKGYSVYTDYIDSIKIIKSNK